MIYRLLLGFMVPTWFLSMWISNTAATAMMIPLVEAVLHQMKPQHTFQDDKDITTGRKNADLIGFKVFMS